MWSLIREGYAQSARLARSLPLLIAFPMMAELTQHIVEYRIGMFTNVAAMRAVAGNADRMGFGQLKVLSLIFLLYWVSRGLAFGRGGAHRVLGDGRSAWLFLWVTVYIFGVGLVQQFGGAFLAPYVGRKALVAIGFGFFAASVVVDLYLTVWKVGAALGNRALTPRASFGIMHGNFWWSLGYFVIMFAPGLVIHYALNGLAVGRPSTLLWVILVFDALLVGYFGILIAVGNYIIARRAAERKGVSLI